MLRMQTIFNRAGAHMLKQNKCASDAYGCKYLIKETGLKCAIGALIPKSAYHEGMENETPRSLAEKFPTMQALFGNPRDENNIERFDMLEELQELHDCTKVSCWRSGLHAIAKTYGLTKLPAKGKVA